MAAGQYSYLESPLVAQLLEEYAISPDTYQGYNPIYRNGNSLGDLVAQLYAQTGLEAWGDEYPIVLGGGYLSCRSPGYLPEGVVDYRQLQALFPFDNVIDLCSIQGSDLCSRFLETDLDAYHIFLTDYGKSLTIDPHGIYYIVTDRYTSSYAYNHLTILATYDQTTFARDLLADFFAD